MEIDSAETCAWLRILAELRRLPGFEDFWGRLPSHLQLKTSKGAINIIKSSLKSQQIT